MGNIKVKGIIVGQTDFSDNDRIFTILTVELGTVRAMAKGVRRKKTALSSCRLFIYAEFVLFEGRNLYQMDAVSIIHDFFGISQNVEGFALACYIAELTESISVERMGDLELVRLLLNSFYLIEENKYPIFHIKTVFEWRLVRCAGYLPELGSCALCGKKEAIAAFSVSEARVYCAFCVKDQMVTLFPMDDVLYHAMCYILYTPLEKAFSFSMNNEALKSLSKISEEYVKYYLKSQITTLSYFYEVCPLG